MSQDQPQRPEQDAIKYGDMFPVQGELADKPIAPGDASLMQAAETTVLGQVPAGGVAAAMNTAAAVNEMTGAVGHDAVNQMAAEQGVTITDHYVPGARVITEAVGGQVVGQFVQPIPVASIYPDPGDQLADAGEYSGDQDGDQTANEEGGGLLDTDPNPITIGEALEAVALSAGDKPVEMSDAAAIQAAEVRATGRAGIVPGGIAAAAQSAANHNTWVSRDEDKFKLADVLTDATERLPSDKVATRKDVEGVLAAELRNASNITTHPTGVGASVAAAARLNERDSQHNQ